MLFCVELLKLNHPHDKRPYVEFHIEVTLSCVEATPDKYVEFFHE